LEFPLHLIAFLLSLLFSGFSLPLPFELLHLPPNLFLSPCLLASSVPVVTRVFGRRSGTGMGVGRRTGMLITILVPWPWTSSKTPSVVLTTVGAAESRTPRVIPTCPRRLVLRAMSSSRAGPGPGPEAAETWPLSCTAIRLGRTEGPAGDADGDCQQGH